MTRFCNKSLSFGKSYCTRNSLTRFVHIIQKQNWSHIIIFPFFSYIAWTGDFELAGKDETETLEQKYQRLNCEVRQLLDDLDQLKESGAEKVGNQSLIGLAKQTASLQDQLAGLKLEEYLGSEPVRDLKVSKFRNVLLVSPN